MADVLDGNAVPSLGVLVHHMKGEIGERPDPVLGRLRQGDEYFRLGPEPRAGVKERAREREQGAGELCHKRNQLSGSSGA